MNLTVRQGLYRVLATGFLFFCFDSLYAFEERWNDRAYGDSVEKGGEIVPNSLFRVDGQIWGAYEFADKKPGGVIDTNNGFRIGRTYISVRGDVKEGKFKGWGYRITIDSESSNTTTNGTPAVFMKMAYIQIPIATGLYLRIGQQHVPVIDGQAGTSLQGIWGHCYLDADGKAMWEELGVSSSTDRGIGLIQKHRLFNLHLLLANGEGYKSPGNGGDVGSTGQTEANKIAVGYSKSYGLDLYGMLSLTPFAKDEKDKGLLTIAFPFRFQNVIGVQRKEYSNLIYETNNYKFISGQKRALQDYAYGAEVDLVLKTDVARFTIGAGTVVKVDRRADVITITDSLATLDLTDNADLATFYSDHYVRASDSRGQASYVFAHVRFGKFGLVGRISSGTGTGSLNEKLGVVDGVSTTERTIIEDIIAGNGIDGNLTPSVFRNMDQGRSRFQKT